MLFIKCWYLLIISACSAAIGETGVASSALGAWAFLGQVGLVEGPPSVRDRAVGVSRRVPLVVMKIAGYAPFANKRTRLDMGVLEIPTMAGLRCELLVPRPATQASQAAWAPFDFYTNVLNESEQREQASTLGEPDIFFAGDDDNRNGAADSHRWTMVPQRSFQASLEFGNRRMGEQTRDWAGFLVKFIRGPSGAALKYESLISVRAFPLGGKCEARVFQCQKPSPSGTSCEPDGWTRWLHEITAHADTRGALSDLWKKPTSEREKNDVSALDGEVTDLDSTGTPKGARRILRLATK